MSAMPAPGMVRIQWSDAHPKLVGPSFVVVSGSGSCLATWSQRLVIPTYGCWAVILSCQVDDSMAPTVVSGTSSYWLIHFTSSISIECHHTILILSIMSGLLVCMTGFDFEGSYT